MFTPSRRALAVIVGRMSGEVASPASVNTAERRLTLSMLHAATERHDTCFHNVEGGGAKARTDDPVANKATEKNRFIGGIF